VPTDTSIAAARSFALRLAAWSLGLFGLFRLPWITTHVLMPATRWQAAGAAALLGPPTRPVEATLACSGADALALCLAAILAYPIGWRVRAKGAVLGTTLILALNTIRIGTLGRAAASPWWFTALHVYIWPALLTIAIAAFVFAWMRVADRPRSTAIPASGGSGGPAPLLSVRFALVAAACLVVFTLAAPLYLASERVLAVAVLVARAAAVLLRAGGVAASASGGVLTTHAGGFLVTQECISTPLIPLYAAALLVYARPWRRAALWAAAGVPLFVGIGIARLLVVAIPAGIDRPPAFLVHAFSQLLVGAGLVAVTAVWRHGVRIHTGARIAVALAIATTFVLVLGAPYTRAIVTFGDAADPQGAIHFLPAFQFGLFLALWVAAFAACGWARFLCAAGVLAAVQVTVSATVPYLAAHAGIFPLLRDVRAWAIVGPALVIAAVVKVAPTRG
jgi:exosortase/archaeosortase family protein